MTGIGLCLQIWELPEFGPELRVSQSRQLVSHPRRGMLLRLNHDVRSSFFLTPPPHLKDLAFICKGGTVEEWHQTLQFHRLHAGPTRVARNEAPCCAGHSFHARYLPLHLAGFYSLLWSAFYISGIAESGLCDTISSSKFWESWFGYGPSFPSR